jgi:hypothetical protein
MKVTAKLNFAEYDKWCQLHLPTKLPLWDASASFERNVGDCIYFYDGAIAKQRKSVHSAGDMERDLGGKFVLLSEEFYYFGRNAVELPLQLQHIRHPWVGHRSKKNGPFEKQVVNWLRQGCGAGWQMGSVHGAPIHQQLIEKAVRSQVAERSCAPCSSKVVRPSTPSAPLC